MPPFGDGFRERTPCFPHPVLGQVPARGVTARRLGAGPRVGTGLGSTLFMVGSISLLLVGLRRLGLSWPWAVALFAWPPIFNGIMSGNVAVALFGLFALAPWFGAGLLIAPAFKPYAALAAIWLVKERHWNAVIVGAAVVLAVGVAGRRSSLRVKARIGHFSRQAARGAPWR